MKHYILILLILLFAKSTFCQDSSFYYISSLSDHKREPNYLKDRIGIVLEDGVEFEWENKPENAIGSIESCNTFLKNPSSYQKVQQLKRLKYLSYSASNGPFSSDCDNLDKYISYLPFPDSLIWLEYEISTVNDTFGTGIEKLTNLKFFSLDYYSWPLREDGFTLKKCHVNQGLNYLIVRDYGHRFVDASFYDYTNILSITLYSNSIDSIPDGISKLANLIELVIFPAFNDLGSQLKYLPSDIGSLKKLQSLDLWCPNLMELPASFAKLDSLKYFGMEYCRSMKSFPNQIFSLKGIRTIACDPTQIELLKQTSPALQNTLVTEVLIWPYTYTKDEVNHYKKSNFIKRGKYKRTILKHFPNAKITYL